jgi:hypothetical protein
VGLRGVRCAVWAEPSRCTHPWALAVQVAAVQDNVDVGSVAHFTVLHTVTSSVTTYDGIAVAGVDVNLYDDDTAALTAAVAFDDPSVTLLSRVPGPAWVMVTLTLATRPRSAVTLTPATAPPGSLVVSPASVTLGGSPDHLSATFNVSILLDAALGQGVSLVDVAFASASEDALCAALTARVPLNVTHVVANEAPVVVAGPDLVAPAPLSGTVSVLLNGSSQLFDGAPQPLSCNSSPPPPHVQLALAAHVSPCSGFLLMFAGSLSWDLETPSAALRFQWTAVGAVGAARIQTPALPTTSVTGLVPGTYTLRLTVTDRRGVSSWDDVTVCSRMPCV